MLDVKSEAYRAHRLPLALVIRAHSARSVLTLWHISMAAGCFSLNTFVRFYDLVWLR